MNRVLFYGTTVWADRQGLNAKELIDTVLENHRERTIVYDRTQHIGTLFQDGAAVLYRSDGQYPSDVSEASDLVVQIDGKAHWYREKENYLYVRDDVENSHNQPNIAMLFPQGFIGMPSAGHAFIDRMNKPSEKLLYATARNKIIMPHANREFRQARGNDINFPKK